MITTPDLKQPPAGLPTLDPVRPGEPMLELRLNGTLLLFPLRHARLLAFQAIPAWMRDSSIDPPAPPPDAEKIGFNKGLLEFIRSSFKNLIRLKLGTVMRGLYGADEQRWPPDVHMPKGKEDALPIIVQTLTDGVVNMAFHHPLDITYDELSGLVTDIRPGYRVAGTVDAGNAARAARATTPGSRDSRQN